MADLLNVFRLMLLQGFWQLAEILWQFVNELPIYLNNLCPFNYLYILPTSLTLAFHYAVCFKQI